MWNLMSIQIFAETEYSVRTKDNNQNIPYCSFLSHGWVVQAQGIVYIVNLMTIFTKISKIESHFWSFEIAE